MQSSYIYLTTVSLRQTAERRVAGDWLPRW